jgi:hypothetical protein
VITDQIPIEYLVSAAMNDLGEWNAVAVARSLASKKSNVIVGNSRLIYFEGKLRDELSVLDLLLLINVGDSAHHEVGTMYIDMVPLIAESQQVLVKIYQSL